MKVTEVFVTGNGTCPWCGKQIQGDKPETHHVHLIIRKLSYSCKNLKEKQRKNEV